MRYAIRNMEFSQEEKRMSKKIFSVAWLVVLALVIAACGAPPAPQPTAAPAQPTAAPAQPTAAPAQPTAAPAQPTAAPAQPTTAPAPTQAAPTAAPAQPTAAPTTAPAGGGTLRWAIEGVNELP